MYYSVLFNEILAGATELVHRGEILRWVGSGSQVLPREWKLKHVWKFPETDTDR